MDRNNDIRETHSGIVILIGDRAYKVKKPVDLGFLDFRTEQSRHDACRRELDLNRRLAPDVYLDLASVAGSDGAVCDHVLVMRRMPEARRLSTLVAAGVDVDRELRALAGLLAEFHATAERSPQISEAGRQAGLRSRWIANLDETEQFCPDVLDPQVHSEIGRRAERYLAGREPLLDARAEAGHVVDGHGDLLAEDIFCLPDGPRVLDCLEFDDRLRWVDVLDDVAFLAMDLERLGRLDLAEGFLSYYRRASGARPVPSLQHHYIAYRAYVRAKVNCIRAAQGAPEAAAAARAFAAQTLRHLRAGEVTLTLVGGGPGTGKTTLARALAEQLDADLLSTDLLRHDRPGRPGDERYSAASKQLVYELLLTRARDALGHGRCVVADATWPSTAVRALAAETATSTASRLIALECHAPTAVAARRADRRRELGHDASEADGQVARRLAAERDPWPQAVRVDTAGSPEAALAAARAVLADSASRAAGTTSARERAELTRPTVPRRDSPVPRANPGDQGPFGPVADAREARNCKSRRRTS